MSKAIFRRRRTRRFTLTAVLCLLVAAVSMAPLKTSAQTDEMRDANKYWRSTLAPIIEIACLDCHSGDQADGSLDLSQYRDIAQIIEDRQIWKVVARRLRNGEMPPVDGPELADQDRTKLLTWIESRLPTLPCNHSHHAGPVTLRRLTRFEYKNTVRSLLGVECELADDFPADEVGYGFDNIGDVLSTSPLLLEKYLAAAESICEKTIFDPEEKRLDVELGGADFSGNGRGRVFEDGQILVSNGTLSKTIDIPYPGQYEIVVEAYGHQAGDEPVEMGIHIDGTSMDTVKIESKRDKPSFHRFKPSLRRGRIQLGVSFNNDYYQPDDPDTANRDRNFVLVAVTVSGPRDFTFDDYPRPHREFVFANPDSEQNERQCVEKILRRHGSRAFRRKITDGEMERFYEIFRIARSDGESFEGAMRVVLQSLLVSPNFLFKVEAATPEDGSPRQLSDYELATAMAYFIWGSMPDDRLFRLATNGQLSERDVLRREISRMLSDEKSSALVDSFGEQWLQLRLLSDIDPDPGQFPEFTEHLRQSMLQETKMLLAHVIRSGHSLQTLLDADYTFANRALARHYGLPTNGIKRREFSKIELAGTPRRGLLTHASILTLTSNPTRTSPVKRGKWVLENLLADPPPPALPDVPQLDAQIELKGTLRQRMEQHRRDPNCASCHRQMDAIGFALENYDAVGKYRTSDAGQPIDATGELPGGSKFAGPEQLQRMIANEKYDQFVRCICEKLFIFALGRGPTPRDDCVLDQIARDAIELDSGFEQIIIAIIESQPFQMRAAH